MAWIQASYFSDALEMCVNCNVLLPVSDYNRKDLPRRKTLWLLHGAFGNCDDWMRRTSIERYAQKLNLAVVMPSAQLSSYMDMQHGGRFYTYISQDLPGKMRAMFPLSDKREDNYIAGLSMGGFGAMMLGMANPDTYSAIGCLSSGIDYVGGILPDRTVLGRVAYMQGYRDVRGNALLIARGEAPKVRVFMAVGQQDELLPAARVGQDFFRAFPPSAFDFTWQEGPGGHTWEFWDEYIQHFLLWLNLPEVPGLH